MFEKSHLAQNVNVYQYLRELEHFVDAKAEHTQGVFSEFVEDTKSLKDLHSQMNDHKKNLKSLVIRYCRLLEGVRDDSTKFTDNELNSLTAVHNMRKRDLKEAKETLISFSAPVESLDSVESLISKNLKSLQSFLKVVNG
jgi:ABC-type transporter Mla subunit MlaD